MDRPKCKHCGAPAKKYSTGKQKRRGYWMSVCRQCHSKPWRKHRKEACERCGFVPEWMGQLDVDHIDGDKKNNDTSNLQTLCANCHRLKTHENGDYLS